MPSQDERLMTPGQVARVFGVKPRAVQRWANDRKLTVRRTLGGHRRYLEAEVRRLAAVRAVPASVPDLGEVA